MEFKNLKKALDSIKSLGELDVAIILSSAEADFNSKGSLTKASSKEILEMFNSVFDKKSRVISKKVLNKYKEILKHYNMAELQDAMVAASEDSFHQEAGYQYCTIEYFSRIEQIDKWTNIKKVKKVNSNFEMPKFYTKKNG